MLSLPPVNSIVVERFDEIVRRGRLAAASLDAGLRGSAHHFLDEGGADAIRALDRLAHDGFAYVQSFAVEPDQLFSSYTIRQGCFDRLIDAAGTPGKRNLQLLGRWL